MKSSHSSTRARVSILFVTGVIALTGCGGGSGTPTPTPPPPTAISVTVTPNPAALTTGATQQFTATIVGSAPNGVTWAVNGMPGGTGPTGTISATGLYVTPFPVPPSISGPAITVTATSVDDPTKSGAAAVNLTVPATTGPALAVDAAAAQHPINPLIYGMNAYLPTGNFALLANDVHLSLDRWGGDQTTRYNYLLDVYNSASDYYYETYNPANEGAPDVSTFNLQVARDLSTHTTTLGTMPLIGWTTKLPATNPVCGFSVIKYGAQQKTDPYNPDCGNGNKPNGNQLTGNDPADTSFPIDQTFTTGWMQYLVTKFGNAASGGVAIYDLDNEPEYWGFVHHDVHPAPLSYDELTTKGITYATAIKTVDPTAQVSGPIISSWNGYFYSPTDWVSGWSTGPNYVYNGNPVDRIAHGDVPLMDYYLQHFKAAEVSGGVRLLDFVDIHAYYAAAGANFSPAGATDLQAARLNSTRAFWDPTYTDPAYTDPNNRTNTAPPVPPMLIPRLRAWVANDYPGTKLAIDEYNWGAQDHVNGAVAQADILGIFGREGLDLGALWGAPDPATQQPSVNAFKVFRNYDNAGSQFGDTSVSATSADQSKLAIYAATRASDHTLTVVMVNKSFNDLSSTISLNNVVPTGPAKVYLYSNANLLSIVSQPDLTVSGGGITATFPAQSITVFAIPM
ncbi:MAG TPA: glycoside hydrolase family 44 protein [Acidisarcina sp.]